MGQFRRLISTVQCTNVRFKDHRLVDTDDDTDADRMGAVFSEATDLTSKKGADEESPAEDATAALVEEDVTNQTFSLTNSTCDSTFVLDDSEAKEEKWRPPTPPKKMMRLDSATGKENFADSVMPKATSSKLMNIRNQQQKLAALQQSNVSGMN